MLLVGYSYKRPFMKLKLRLIFWSSESDELIVKEFDREMVANWVLGGTYSIGACISKRKGKDVELIEKFRASDAYAEYRASEYVEILMSELGESL